MVIHPFLRAKMLISQKNYKKNARESHILATCSEYQKCLPNRRYEIVSKNNLCSNCLSNKHFKQSFPSTRRCQTCEEFHDTTLHDPSKQFKLSTAALSASNPNQPTNNLTSQQTQSLVRQQNQNKCTETVNSKKRTSTQDMVNRFRVNNNYNNKKLNAPIRML